METFTEETILTDETEEFFNELYKTHLKLSAENCNLSMRENWFWGGGKNIELNKHTIVIQRVKSAADREDRPYLSIALYDLTFDEDGRAISSTGTPLRNFDFDVHCLRHQEIECSHGSEGIVWKERSMRNRQYSTEQLIQEWIEELLKKSASDEAFIKALKQRIDHDLS